MAEHRGLSWDDSKNKTIAWLAALTLALTTLAAGFTPAAAASGDVDIVVRETNPATATIIPNIARVIPNVARATPDTSTGIPHVRIPRQRRTDHDQLPSITLRIVTFPLDYNLLH